MISEYFLACAKQSIDKGPVFVSSDFYRCLTSYSVKQFPSVLAEVKFLSQYYVEKFTDMCHQACFAVCAPLDIVWGYSIINDPILQHSYLVSKSRTLCELKDMLLTLDQWKYYCDLPAFLALESLEFFHQVVDGGITTPIGFTDSGSPVTSFQQHLYTDVCSLLPDLPKEFGYCGYNFVKSVEEYRRHFVDICHLSHDPCALFHYYDDSLLVVPTQCVLFDLRSDVQRPLSKYEGDIVDFVKTMLKPANLLDFPMAVVSEVVFKCFIETFPNKLYPFVGNQSQLLVSIVDDLKFGVRLSD